MRLIEYLKREGAFATAKKAAAKASSPFGGVSAATVFMVRERTKDVSAGRLAGYEFSLLKAEDARAFDEFNFFPHIEGADYIDRLDCGVLACKRDGAICAYVCFERGRMKTIHGTGFFSLGEDEAWIGPCYVDRAHRGKGLNGELVRTALELAELSGVSRFFTAINRANVASLSSFERIGFEEFAFYDSRTQTVAASPGSGFASMTAKIEIEEPRP